MPRGRRGRGKLARLGHRIGGSGSQEWQAGARWAELAHFRHRIGWLRRARSEDGVSDGPARREGLRFLLLGARLSPARRRNREPGTAPRTATPAPRPSARKRPQARPPRVASASASRIVVRPRPSTTDPRASSSRSTLLTVAREVPARPERSSWVSGITAFPPPSGS
jgi:hypothetical protein